MAQEFTIFDEDSLREIAERIREFQAQYKGAREFLARLRREPYGHVIRTVKTSTRSPDFEQYPQTGSVFPFQFEDWEFDETAGASGTAETEEWPEKKPIGQIYSDQWVPEGTRLIAVKIPSKSKGFQWYGFHLPSSLIRFELTARLCADLAAVTSATAQELDSAMAKTGPELTVYDTVGHWHGAAGYQGWATKQGDRWEIIYLEALARFIQFELMEDMTANCSSAGYGDQGRSARVINYWGGAPNSKDPTGDGGDTVTVYDRAELFPLALFGAHGFAIYDELDPEESSGNAICRGKYIVVQCDQQTLWMMAECAYAFCCDEAVATIESPLEGTAQPFGQVPNPLPTEALNIYSLAAEEGDQVAIIFSHLYCDWIVLQVQHKCINVLTEARLYDPGENCKKLQFGRRQIAVAMCAPETVWPEGAGSAGVYQLALSAVTVVNDITFAGLDGDPNTFSAGECTLSKSTRRVCVLDDSAASSDPTVSAILQFAEKAVVVDVYDSGSALVQTVQLVHVACIGSSADETIISTTECATGSA